MSPAIISRRSGESLTLSAEIARGGEGAIHTIEGAPGDVAKIYLKALTPAKAQKIAAMTRVASPELQSVAAWPTDVLTDVAGRPVGFVMPRMSAHADTHELYSPRSRAVTFPAADFRFLAHVAGNIARAFATVHAAGHVIGDINHSHMLVGPDGKVVLIDVDSFQVTVEGVLYTCDVGSPLFTAPEIQGQNFRGLERDPGHDLFGLAVVLFHLLAMGRHPFAGVWRGPGEMPIERAITEGRFAYARGGGSTAMRPPPGALALDTLGEPVASLFEAALGARSGGRPSAARWIGALDDLKRTLKACATNEAHAYPPHLSTCPWCELERVTGARLFGSKLKAPGETERVDLAQLWRVIAGVPPPSPDPPLPSATPWRPPPGMAVPTVFGKRARQIASILALLTGLYGCTLGSSDDAGWVWLLGAAAALAIWPRPPKQKVAEADKALSAAQASWTRLERRWSTEASAAVFLDLKASLATARAKLVDLPNEHRRALDNLKRDLEAFQRRRYLDRFRIDRGKIAGIGPGRATTLASFGVETAADISSKSVGGVPGFGPTLTGALMSWRKAHEANFRFNPAEPADPGEIQRVDREMADKRRAFTEELRKGAGRLQVLPRDIEAARARLSPLMKEAWDQLQLARARKRAL